MVLLELGRVRSVSRGGGWVGNGRGGSDEQEDAIGGSADDVV